MGYIVLFLLALLVLFAFSEVYLGRQKTKQAEERAAKNAVEAANAATFQQQQQPEWPHMHGRKSWRDRTYIMLSEDRYRLRRTLVQLEPDIIVKTDNVVAITDIVSVELQQDSHTVLSLDSVGTSKAQGGLARAALGGALLGGAGAVVGAATADRTTVTKTEGVSRTVKGTATLVVGTTDAQAPVLKVDMASYEEGERWLHLLRGSLALIARNGAGA